MSLALQNGRRVILRIWLSVWVCEKCHRMGKMSHKQYPIFLRTNPGGTATLTLTSPFLKAHSLPYSLLTSFALRGPFVTSFPYIPSTFFDSCCSLLRNSFCFLMVICPFAARHCALSVDVSSAENYRLDMHVGAKWR